MAPNTEILEPINDGQPTSTSVILPQEESRRIRQALYVLWDLSDREAWQTVLLVSVLEQANPADDYDALDDPRLEDLRAGFNLYFRFFEVRPDLTIKHQPEKFDDAGFLHITNPWTYADRWWSTVSDDVLKVTEEVLVGAGVLEFKETRTTSSRTTCVRLRADRIIEILIKSDPKTYRLGFNHNTY